MYEVDEVCLKDAVLYWILLHDHLLLESFQCLGRVNCEIDVEMNLLAWREQLFYILPHYGKLKLHVGFVDVETVQFDLLEVALRFQFLHLFWSLQIYF